MVTHIKHNSRNPELQIYREAFPQVHGNPMEEIKQVKLRIGTLNKINKISQMNKV